MVLVLGDDPLDLSEHVLTRSTVSHLLHMPGLLREWMRAATSLSEISTIWGRRRIRQAGPSRFELWFFQGLIFSCFRTFVLS
jgi:hypothetical protein